MSWRKLLSMILGVVVIVAVVITIYSVMQRNSVIVEPMRCGTFGTFTTNLSTNASAQEVQHALEQYTNKTIDHIDEYGLENWMAWAEKNNTMITIEHTGYTSYKEKEGCFA